MKDSATTPPPRLVLGPRKCGKSEAMELALLNWPHRLYVGTLWDEPAFAETLRVHRERRGDGWGLLEVTGTLEADAQALWAGVVEMDSPAAVLVDGLTTWAAQVAVRPERLLGSATDLAEVLAFCARQFPAILWCWVDAVDDDDPQLASCSRALWRRLGERVPGLVVEMWPESRSD